MGEFRIGRKFASHSYPETRRDTTVPYAGNFARGPATDLDISDGAGTQVDWPVLSAGTPGGVNVPITPRSTGTVRLVGAFTVQNIGEDPANVTIQAKVNGSLVVPVVEATVEAAGFATLPYVLDIVETVGVTTNIQIIAVASVADVLQLVTSSSTLDVQEIPTATG